MTLSLTFIALFSACSWAFCSSGGHGGLFVSTVRETSPPAPGGSLTAWKSVFGYLVKPGLTWSSGCQEVGAWPWTGMKVGSLPRATPFGWAATVAGAAAAVLRLPGAAARWPPLVLLAHWLRTPGGAGGRRGRVRRCRGRRVGRRWRRRGAAARRQQLGLPLNQRGQGQRSATASPGDDSSSRFGSSPHVRRPPSLDARQFTAVWVCRYANGDGVMLPGWLCRSSAFRASCCMSPSTT